MWQATREKKHIIYKEQNKNEGKISFKYYN